MAERSPLRDLRAADRAIERQAKLAEKGAKDAGRYTASGRALTDTARGLRESQRRVKDAIKGLCPKCRGK